MVIQYNDLLRQVELDGHIFPDIFDTRELKIFNLERISEHIEITPYDRLDVLSKKIFGDEGYYWVILLLNPNIYNPLAMNFDNSEKYTSFVKTLMYNPIRFIKDDIMRVIHNSMNAILNVTKNIESGNIICDEIHSVIMDNTLVDFISLSDILFNILYKNQIEANLDLDIQINDYKEYVNNFFNDNNIYNLIDNIQIDELDIYDTNKYQIIDETLVSDEYNIYDLTRIVYYLKYVYFWSENEVKI